MLLDGRRKIVFFSVRWRKTTYSVYRFETCVLRVQKKAIAAVVGGVLEEAIKDNVGVPQLANVVGPPYLRNKQQEISAGPQINARSRLTTGASRPWKK